MQTQIARSDPDEVDYVWLRMLARYPGWWAKFLGTSPAGIAKAEWAEQIAGLTHAQVVDGFARDAARASPFPPSAPQFAALCVGEPRTKADDVVRSYESGHTHVADAPRIESERGKRAAARAFAEIAQKLGIPEAP